ncbi:putative TetR-family transcriptional regulator [Actinoplanes missouriensis 431]|uniref:Putative TetR-family transcriptional regulator n=1 Tax=Actinoplanes missouriensis (strain ATCC 14538 / DSM 43046 / CBS 188.64 / JCM 3121 / NBRC 102363 / NCIMB 12654 / NRRL B-3342 / UNCC 431) TaxID=512565 RepID=I0H828_ACTM4|nr:TetR/AcrR family transcriptional regulator [Actinoplanes missouriensis]BAL89165.1 putative TetR-family transcriptional regulator [Actinoplanes missouriensis 431]
MATRTRNTERLSRERIVEAAVELLDTTGEDGLTFRALSAHLRTGPGAIYWHVANKGELLDAATDAVLTRGMTGEAATGTPQEVIRAIALVLFDAIDEHPWVGAQLSDGPWRSVTLQICERIGQQIQRLGVPGAEQFMAASAVMLYILGAARQNAANARMNPPGADRAAILATQAAAWEGLDPEGFPFLRHVAGQMREHDDREQFVAGLDLILVGITGLA